VVKKNNYTRKGNKYSPPIKGDREVEGRENAEKRGRKPGKTSLCGPYFLVDRPQGMKKLYAG